MRRTQSLICWVVLVLMAVIPTSSAPQPAQPRPQSPAAGAPPPLPVARPERPAAQAGGSLQIPDGYKQRILIRTTIIALNHANLTGNYSVLRDLGAPGFREANTAARLAEIFSMMRHRNIDLGPVVVVEPLLSREAFIDERGMLRLDGYFPTRPEQVNFELAFQVVDGQWRVFTIFVNTTEAPPVAGSANPGR